MSDMMQNFIKKTVDEMVLKKYSHIKVPATVCARVMNLTQKDTYCVYTLKILDKNGNEDNDYPEIPGIKSDVRADKGDRVAVALLYGVASNVYLLGKVIE